MIKLHVLNMKNFLDTVNACKGAVNMLRPDGTWLDISRHYEAQKELMEQYRENKNHLRLTLEIPTPKDYMNLISYYAGDC